MNSIEIKNLDFKIQEKLILENINLKIEKGKITGLIGESGSGKTTIFRLILNLIEEKNYYQTGNILFNENQVNSIDRKLIQPIFQDPSQYFNTSFTLEQALLEPIEINFPKNIKEKKFVIETYLKEFSISLERLKSNMREFSGGELQRIAIIRALLVEPEILCMDEPISGLDPIMQKQVFKIIQKLNKEKKITIFLISHDLDFIKEISDYIYIIQEGKIIEEGTSIEIFDSPKKEYTKLLKNSRNLTDLKKKFLESKK